MASGELTEQHLTVLSKFTPEWRSVMSPQLAQVCRELADLGLVEWDTSRCAIIGGFVAEGRVRLASDVGTTLSDLLELPAA